MITGLYEAHLPVKELERSIAFYEKLGLACAFQNERVAFFWIEHGKSWLGLWKAGQAELPYHPSVRHVAFRMEQENIDKAQDWLKERGIEVRSAFGVAAADQPLVLDNHPHAHAAIYFEDPDGNSLELIAPLRFDMETVNGTMPYQDWQHLFETESEKKTI